MVKTVAERQRAYREKLAKQGNKRKISLMIDLIAKNALGRLAKHYGLTQQRALERVLIEHEYQLLDRMKTEERENYFAGDHFSLLRYIFRRK